ncbi:MAG: metal-dependent hydrolase [Inquilinus sp.]|nr:metal-dependent hydrolase [Inquilinus sp.]
MDSITQFLLGASISGAALGSRLGGRALLIGGLVATIPDLDSFVPLGNAIDTMTHHRGASHSLFVLSAAAPAVAFAVTRLAPATRPHWRRVLATVWLCLVTHPLLDALTTYGTQIFWPLDVGAPVAVPAVFIIDPVYTVLLLVGVLAVWLMRRNRPRALRLNRALLAAGTLYLGLGLAGHAVVRGQAEGHPDFAGLPVHVQPAPFNIVFWQVLAVADDHYVTGLATPLSSTIGKVARHARLAVPGEGFEPSDSVRRLEWFTDGFYTYRDTGGGLAITDLRMGYHPSFAFSFDIARRRDGALAAITPVHAAAGPPMSEAIGQMLARVPGLI